MSDRHRLAADLHDTECDPLLTFDCEVDHLNHADRLIALGWTRLDDAAFVESIGLACCPHTEPASLREHVENDGSCVVCREYIAHTDDGHRLAAWPCPTVRAATLNEERLARALLRVQYETGLEWEAVQRDAAEVAKAYREDTDG